MNLNNLSTGELRGRARELKGKLDSSIQRLQNFRSTVCVVHPASQPFSSHYQYKFTRLECSLQKDLRCQLLEILDEISQWDPTTAWVVFALKKHFWWNSVPRPLELHRPYLGKTFTAIKSNWFVGAVITPISPCIAHGTLRQNPRRRSQEEEQARLQNPSEKFTWKKKILSKPK